jgi:hypothetical protein
MADEMIVVREDELAGVAAPMHDVVYTLRPLKPGKWEELRRAVLFDRMHLDLTELDARVNDWVIVSWVGINMDGGPAPCTRENKLRLPHDVLFALQAVASTAPMEWSQVTSLPAPAPRKGRRTWRVN